MNDRNVREFTNAIVNYNLIQQTDLSLAGRSAVCNLCTDILVELYVSSLHHADPLKTLDFVIFRY